MDPFFSIVIPTYNRAHIITSTIQSVLAQSYQNLEIVVVDDGSTDNTKEVLSRYNDHRIRYYKKQNEERGAARNFGVKHANGEYIVYLDSDDIVKPKFLETVYNELEKNSFPELLHPRFNVIDEEGKVLEERPEITNESYKKLLTRNYFACNFVIRKTIAEAFPFIEDRKFVVGEDWYVWLRLISRYKLHYINDILVSQVRSSKEKYIISIDNMMYSMNAMEEHLRADEIFMQKYSTSLKSIRATMELLISIQYSLQGKSLEALKFMTKYLINNPGLFAHKLHFMALKSLLTGLVKSPN